MPLWQGKSKATPLGYRIFVATLQYLGLTPAYALLHFVALYYLCFSFKSTKASYHFFRNRIGYRPLRSFISVYRNYICFGQSLIDKIVMLSGIPNRFTFDFDGEDRLHEMVQLGKGGMLLSAHTGNWEIAGHLLKRLDTKIHIVLFDGEDEAVRKYLSGVTGKRNIGVIVIRNDLSHIYAISEALRNNEIICMHADRFLEGNKTLKASFIGTEAKFPIGPFLLAQTFKVPVSFVFAMKESKLHYHFFAAPLIDEYSGEKMESVHALMKRFAFSMEEKVRTYPEQWYNFYNFWQQ